MIVGSNISADGAILQRLPVKTKLAIGLAPSGARNYPERLDHFLFLKRGPDKGSWVPDEILMKHYAPECKHELAESCPKCCREVKILFMDDDLESSVFPNQLAWWSKSGKKCWGDGVQATRRTEEFPIAGQSWTPCRNAGCPDWERGDCAASGDLRFLLADFPTLGSICRIHTSSLRSVENLYSALNMIQTFTGGRLAGVTVPMRVTMEATSYLAEGKRKSTVVPILSIQTGVNELIDNIKATAAIWDSARKAFGKRVLTIEDDEESRAAEIPPEFPRKDAPKELAAQPEAPKAETKQADAIDKAYGQPAPAQAQAQATKPEPKKPIGAKTVEGLIVSVQQGKGKVGVFHKIQVAISPEAKQEIFVMPDQADLVPILKDAKKREQPVLLACNVFETNKPGEHGLVAMECSLVVKASAPLPAQVPAQAESGDEMGWMLEG